MLILDNNPPRLVRKQPGGLAVGYELKVFKKVDAAYHSPPGMATR